MEGLGRNLISIAKGSSVILAAVVVSFSRLGECVSESIKNRTRDMQAGDSIVRHFECAWQEAQSMSAALLIDLYYSLGTSFRVDQLMVQLEEVSAQLKTIQRELSDREGAIDGEMSTKLDVVDKDEKCKQQDYIEEEEEEEEEEKEDQEMLMKELKEKIKELRGMKLVVWEAAKIEGR
jgi:hypothetical protein